MIVSVILEVYRRCVARRRVVRELDKLTDEDLADVGLVRSQIADCASGNLKQSGS